ncbi:MAG: fused MFS/spermidine synthase [Saprospiraceae bacterium]|nr:fused MFS/spermidine synthase [Saprospiraceae bacterium]
MQIPLWKKIISYITEIHAESSSSEFNELLQVNIVNGQYQLCTSDAIYSYGDKYDNFGDSFKKLDLDSIHGKDVLVLGLGLGSIPLLLEKKEGKKYRYTAVEIDDEIIRLAGKYVLDELESEIEIVCIDAMHFLLVDQKQFDLIMVDIFINDRIPEPFLESDFLHLLGETLRPQGLILMNILYRTSVDKRLADQYFGTIFKIAFPEAFRLEVKGNLMMMNTGRYLKSNIG